MKKYKIYNKTNSNFIPEIPLNWKKLRVKNLVDNNTYYPVGDGDHGSIKPEMYLEEGVPYIRVQNLSWTGELLLDNVVYISEEVQKANSKSILRPGDILIAKTGATVGKLGLIPNELKEANTTSSVGKLTIDLSRFNPKYILYSFQAKHFNDQIWMQASQKSAQPGFNIDDLIEFEIASPELEEQTQIAAFLDYKTNLIDATIEKKKRLIELLKEKNQALINEAVTKGLNPNTPMKDSGVEWLGEIPEHWLVKKLKFAVDFKTEKASNIGRGIALEDITSWTGEGNLRDTSHFEGDLILFEKGDVLFNKLRPYLAKVYMANEEGGAVGELMVLRPKQNIINQPFLFNRLISKGFINVVDGSTYGAKMPRASVSFILDLKFGVPPIEEQIEINSYINNITDKSKRLITKLENIIEKFQTYRQSLISEAVTGKIDVRDWQSNTKKV